jgi:hypothetical protein
MVTTCEGPESAGDESWYLDIGCSNYMTSHKEWLANFHGSKKSRVKYHSSISAEGVGNVVIRRRDGGQVVIENVLYVLAMRYNLLRPLAA